MATPLLSRPPTCLSCLRRSFAVPSSSSTQLGLVSLPLTQQVLGKKTRPPKDRGCIVRLLEDIPQYGRKNTIIRTQRARMRNLWFPFKKAEYMTATRFAELGLKLNDEAAILEREPMFGVVRETVSDDLADELDMEDFSEPVVKAIAPARAIGLLDIILSEELTFHRKIIVEAPPAPELTPDPVKPRSPLLADTARVAGGAATAKATPPAASGPTVTRIFGSVSAEDIAARIRELCQTAAAAGEDDAGLIRVEARDVRFVLSGKLDEGLEEVDRVRALGKWEVDILIRGESDEVVVLKRTVIIAGGE